MSTLKRVPIELRGGGKTLLKGTPLTLKAGSNDTVVAWCDGTWAFVLSYSYRHGYAGLSRYEKSPGTWELYGEAFLQGEECPQELLDKSDASIRNFLMEYLT